MMRLTAVTALFAGMAERDLAGWVDRGWVEAARAGDGLEFDEISIARVRLIQDLRTGMAIDDETIPVVLSLLDQVHTLRGQLRSLMRAVDAQPDAVRRAILDLVAGGEPF